MTTELENKKQRLMNLAMQDQQICICQKCGTVYQIKLLKPGENYNNFGILFCHYCGDLTESFPDWVKVKTQRSKEIVILVTISGGLIDQIKFYKKPIYAVTALTDFVQAMDVENEDAGVYNKNGLIANAKDFLDENDKFMENQKLFERIKSLNDSHNEIRWESS